MKGIAVVAWSEASNGRRFATGPSPRLPHRMTCGGGPDECLSLEGLPPTPLLGRVAQWWATSDSGKRSFPVGIWSPPNYPPLPEHTHPFLPVARYSHVRHKDPTSVSADPLITAKGLQLI